MWCLVISSDLLDGCKFYEFIIFLVFFFLKTEGEGKETHTHNCFDITNVLVSNTLVSRT